MPKLSICIPSREERFLTPTIDDIFRNARSGDTEVVAVLDSNVWPGDWKEVTERHGNRLTTIHNGQSLGMRASINRGIASAVSRGAEFVMKLDGHCALGEGFDEILKAECDADWVVVPRRLRLEPESWTIAEPNKPPYDYHYLSFPDDPNDFGGPGLNGKPWHERQRERAEILLDEEMSSQGSAWFMHADYFAKLELMDEVSYGPFWNEFQEIGLKCWLSGGKVMVNKKTYYAHLHKGKKYGRGYKLNESALTTGRNHTMKWIWNEAWAKQTLPFKWLIEHFWPVPSWPENWEEVLYAERKPRAVSVANSIPNRSGDTDCMDVDSRSSHLAGLVIHSAYYGIGPYAGENIDVTDRARSLVKGNSLDIVVNNSTLAPDQNPFRGKKKHLEVRYSYDNGETVKLRRDEKDWLIIGQAQRQLEHKVGYSGNRLQELKTDVVSFVNHVGINNLKPTPLQLTVIDEISKPLSAPALNDYLIRKFSISPQRLRGPMPIELRDFHRNDLAQLFAELGFKRGAEIGVAEGKYSEVLLKANPDLHLLCVDPWHSYSGNPQNKTKEKNEFAYNEAKRRLCQPDWHVKLIPLYSMEAVQKVENDSLDFVYIDGNHSFDFVMQDLIEWSKRVRSGGVVSGDDYYALDQKRWIGGGVVEAVQAYTNAHRIPIWFLCNAHRSVDYFWVKL